MSIKSQVHTELNRLASLAATGPSTLRLDLGDGTLNDCLLNTFTPPRDRTTSPMPSFARQKKT